MAPRQRLGRAVPRGLVCAGLLLVAVGTFLPWLRSGRATRNSYATDGAVRRLLDVTGAVDLALRAWPFLSLACALAIAFVLAGPFRVGAALAVLVALAAGTVAGWALFSPAHGLIRPAVIGPAVTLSGAIVTVLGVLTCVSGLKRFIGRGSA